MKVEKLEDYPKNCNPFHHDPVSMGTNIASNVTIMHMNFEDAQCEELVIVNTESGERLKITFD
jgi:hypothetical protein